MSIRKYWNITENDVYVRIFDEILNELDLKFFPADLVASYKELKPESRYLVTRMFLRTSKWIRLEDFEKYMALETLQKSVLPELIDKNWIEERPPMSCLINDVASQKELQEAAKEVGLKTSGQSRAQLADSLLQLSRQQAFFGTNRIASKINALLPIQCFFLSHDRRSFLKRLEIMFLYPVGPDATLEVIFLTHMRKQAFFPYVYTPQRDAPLFETVTAFDMYAKARELCGPLEEALASNAAKLPRHLLDTVYLDELDRGLAETAGTAASAQLKQASYVYGRGIFNVSQLFMKAHLYADEYVWIQKYLAQSVHKSKRGTALIRKLLLELRFHEDTGTKGETSWLVSALNTYYDALAEVTPIERLDLDRKTTKLIGTIQKTGLKSALAFVQPLSKSPISQIPVTTLISAPVKIEGAQSGPGTRLMYADGFNVEQTALRHYAEYEGGHYENSMLLTVFWLAVWDLLFSDPMDFRCKYQSQPLNLQKVINQHITEIEARLDNLIPIITENLAELAKLGEPKPFIGSISWYIPQENVLGIVEGLGASIKPILMRIATDYRQHSSGFPDLTLWNPKTRSTKFVEVKSENDTVSDNQQMWMEFLINNGVDVEICKIVPKEMPVKKRRKI